MESETPRFGAYRHALLVLLLVNIVLASMKLVLGYTIDSTALRSDGFNNAADFIYTLLLAMGLWISTQPADESHPEGHGRFESLVGLFVSLVILGTGLFVLWDAVQAFLSEPEVTMSYLAVGLVTFSIVVKGATGWFLWHEGNRLNSSPLNAIGRDQAGDMLADGAVISAMTAVYYDLHWLDPLVASIIGIAILLIGWEPLRKHFRDLTGSAPRTDIRSKIESIVESYELFGTVTTLRAHHVGPKLHVSLTLLAPPDVSLEEVHEAEEALREELLQLNNVSRVFIHVEPPDAHSSSELNHSKS